MSQTIDLRDNAKMLAVLATLIGMNDVTGGLLELGISCIKSLAPELGLDDADLERARKDVVALMEETL